MKGMVSHNMLTKRIIIDCDPGNGIPGANTDDGLALALALGSPSLSIEMITTVSGNTPCETGAQVVNDLLARCRLDIPIFQGAKAALYEPMAAWREQLDHRVHELSLEYLWKDTQTPTLMASCEGNAAQKIAERVCANPGSITLLCLGPLTNIAEALLRYPQMADAVAEIVVMGGAFCLDDYIKDTNFGFDPEAAAIVLHSRAKVTLVPMDVTVNTLLTPTDLNKMTASGTSLALFIRETMTPWITYSMLSRGLTGCWIHDALVVAWLLDPNVATVDDFRVGIELRPGITRGMSWRYRPPLRVSVGIVENAGTSVSILTSVNNQRLLELLAQALNRGVIGEVISKNS